MPGVCAVAGVLGFGGLGTIFFFTGFLGGSVSSTTTFFGGAGWIVAAAFRSRTCVRSCVSSPSFAPANASIRSASARRDRSRELRSFCTD